MINAYMLVFLPLRAPPLSPPSRSAVLPRASAYFSGVANCLTIFLLGEHLLSSKVANTVATHDP